MQDAKEKTKNAASAVKERVEILKAEAEEKVEKTRARSEAEKEIARERRKAKEAEAKKGFHEAKAQHILEKESRKHAHVMRGHGLHTTAPTPVAAVPATTTEGMGPLGGHTTGGKYV